MARRKKEPDPEAPIDESEWEDWRKLRAEMGKRLGGRDATGMSDPEVLDAARKARDPRRRR
ncbi:MAG TPA: hypothetical protein VGR51_07505 [Thermoplasmata archaeon]|nr:hypothetical protein [Thermoplasmata archaeon]